MNEITTSGNAPQTEEYTRAVRLNRRIIAAAQVAQESLYEMCAGFKEMRDSKLYRQLGYDDFGDYCEKETTIKRAQVYRYISIYENLPEELVSPGRQIGAAKLYLLSTLSEAEREQVTEGVDLEAISKRELEGKVAEIKKLREKCEQLTFELDEKDSAADEKATELTAALKKIGQLEAALEEEKKTKVLPPPEMSAEEKELIKAEAQKAADERAQAEIGKAREEAKKAEKSLKISQKKAEAAASEQKLLEKKNRELSEKLAAAEKEKDELRAKAASAAKPLPSSEKERVKVHLQIMLDNFNAAVKIAAGTADGEEKASLKKGLVKAAEQIAAAAERI